MKKTINIANGQGFWGDSIDAPKTLINNKNLDYLTLDYLAEVTMAIMQKQHNKDPKRGYAYDFVEFASHSVDQILENNIKIITNAGGVNPYACAENIKNRTNEKLKVAVVEGDNIIDNTQWRITFRRIAPMSYNDDHLGTNENSLMNNIAVGVFKKIDDYHSVGIELGWEQFGQSFVTSNDNITFTQHQNPMLFWAGASYSFTPVDWLMPYKLYPYARITAGGTSVGPVFKAQSGLNWQVAGNFNILFGYEYGNLLYNVDGVLYDSPKTGIIFGAKFKF